MTASPVTIDELRQVVLDSTPRPLRIEGGGTKRRRSREDGVAGGAVDSLDVRRLSGVLAYDPAECVVTALGGTPVRDLNHALEKHGQYLPWDPPLVAAGSTVGGMVAAGLSGPGRYRYGGVRDFVIGAKVVDGRGRLVASGGQVVKNAAGFLLHHALVGSAGRLGVVVEVSVKVFPRPEATATVVARADTLAAAIEAHERARLAVPDLDALDLTADTATVLLRLGGAAAPLPMRVERARRALALAGAEVLTGDDERRAWAEVSAATWDDGLVVKVPTAPSRLARDLATLTGLGRCHVSAGGAVIYTGTAATLADADTSLAAGGLAGEVVAGDSGGAAVGVRRDDRAFADRVTGALDPDRRFR